MYCLLIARHLLALLFGNFDIVVFFSVLIIAILIVSLDEFIRALESTKLKSFIEIKTFTQRMDLTTLENLKVELNKVYFYCVKRYNGFT